MAIANRARPDAKPAHSTAHSKSSPRGLLSKLLLIVAGAAGFAVAMQATIAGVYRDTRPQLALRFAPVDAAARAKLADQLVASNQDKRIARDLAFDAIRRDPLQPVALRVLGQSEDLNLPVARQRTPALMLESQRLSRRDTLTQLWFIEQYGRLGKPAAMMHHFDIALRSSLDAQDNLFPLLVAGEADPPVKRALFRTIARRPGWEGAFAEYAIRNGADLGLAAQIAPAVLNIRTPDSRVLFQVLLDRLTQAGRFDIAWDLYETTGGKQKTGVGLLRNGSFEEAIGFAPFDWNFAEDADLWASRERAPGGGQLLRVGASGGRSGEAARQMLRLDPGAYLVAARLGDLPGDSDGRPQIVVRCAGAKDVALLSLQPDGPGAAMRKVSGRFVVPANCRFQWIAIGIGSPRQVADASPWIDDVKIEHSR